VDVELRIAGEIDTLEDAHQTCAYRAVQEALTNCIRHAKAQLIHVDVTAAEGGLTISVADDGVGFDAGRRHAGLGLRGIEERFKEVGGRMTITTAPGRGTTLVMYIPLGTPMKEVRLARVAG
jgi:signal transduction histidine kinase